PKSIVKRKKSIVKVKGREKESARPSVIGTPSSEALHNSLQRKLGLSTDSRPNVAPQQANEHANRVSITNEVSMASVNQLLKKDPRFPHLSDFPIQAPYSLDR
ncbi:hypothetical protein PENTCL1PPCAC_28516, partial [Pristionchus entomophagus]